MALSLYQTQFHLMEKHPNSSENISIDSRIATQMTNWRQHLYQLSLIHLSSSDFQWGLNAVKLIWWVCIETCINLSCSTIVFSYYSILAGRLLIIFRLALVSISLEPANLKDRDDSVTIINSSDFDSTPQTCVCIPTRPIDILDPEHRQWLAFSFGYYRNARGSMDRVECDLTSSTYVLHPGALLAWHRAKLSDKIDIKWWHEYVYIVYVILWVGGCLCRLAGQICNSRKYNPISPQAELVVLVLGWWWVLLVVPSILLVVNLVWYFVVVASV